MSLDELGVEPLLPELQPYLRDDAVLGQVFHHPLYIAVPYFDVENKRINKLIPWRQNKVREFKEQRDWARFLFLHERPYRMDAFQEIKSLLTDPEYWEEVSWLWTDSNNIFQHQQVWRRVWLSRRPGRKTVMTEDEQQILAELPEIIPIYRGTFMVPHGCRGMSWTTNREIAVRFATKLVPRGFRPHIVTATVRRRHVLAYLDSQGESEIVTLPERVRDVDIVEIKK